jgi:APA family basic amino acid/polyamine antiporter
MANKELNTWTLSGLMIGPILGSGIIFLPPLAYKSLGSHAIWAWVIMMFLGSLFAYVFAKMTILTTSNEGMSLIIGKVLGNGFREMSSNFLTAAVFFGPTAVIITASDFIKNILPPNLNINAMTIAFILMLLCSFITALGITALGRLLLILSTVTGLLLVLGSLVSIFSVNTLTIPSGFPDIGNLGHTLLLIFWSIIGWEVLGNYVEEVKNPNKTIMRAMKISLVVIVMIYLLTTFALQNYYSQNSGDIKIQFLLTAILGDNANIIFSLLASSLCICTILMFVGAVSRQMTARGKVGLLPRFFSKKYASLMILTFANFATLTVVALGFINLENIVSIANTFFISNALLGLVAGLIYMKGIFIRISIAVLILMLSMLLLFSSFAALICLFIVISLSLLSNKNSNHFS